MLPRYILVLKLRRELQTVEALQITLEHNAAPMSAELRSECAAALQLRAELLRRTIERLTTRRPS
jgi:hypothetical protein